MPSLSSPTTLPTISTSFPTTTYTTIPISGTDAFSRSLQNLSSSFSLFRPLAEFFSPAGFSLPPTLSAAKPRLLHNSHHFRLNYAALIISCAFLSLLFFRAPLSLLLICATFLLWLVLYFFREDPLVLWGTHVSDTSVLAVLVAISAVELWLTGSFWSLLGGISVGAAIAAIHGLLRNDDGLYLDEQEAVSRGLIGPGSSNPSPREWK